VITRAALTTTALEAADGGPVPAAFRALTVNVYDPPPVSPVIRCVVAVDANVWVGWATPERYGVTT
jgi:hypothetical protein